MKFTPVDSSAIAEIGYDEHTKTMEVKFLKGGHYRYEGVTPQHHQTLMKDKSIGAHFRQHIQGKFKQKKIG